MKYNLIEHTVNTMVVNRIKGLALHGERGLNWEEVVTYAGHRPTHCFAEIICTYFLAQAVRIT